GRSGIQEPLLAVSTGGKIEFMNFSVAPTDIHFGQTNESQRCGRIAYCGAAPEQSESSTGGEGRGCGARQTLLPHLFGFWKKDDGVRGGLSYDRGRAVKSAVTRIHRAKS